MAPKRKAATTKSNKKVDEEDGKDNAETFCVVIDDPNTIDYSSKSYWDSRYDKNDIDHEWYFSFDTLEPIFERIISKSKAFGVKGDRIEESQVLEIGCGDRPIIHHLTDLHFKANNLHAIDFSDVVINQLMSLQPSKIDAGINFKTADARQLNTYYPKNNFSLIIDKGTIDAMLSESSTTKAINNAYEICASIADVLALNGVYVLISHIQVDTNEFETLMEEILLPALESKQGSCHWQIEAHIADHGGENRAKKTKKRKKITNEDNNEDENQQSFGTVYIIYALERKRTRHSELSSNVSFEVIDHSEE